MQHNPKVNLTGKPRFKRSESYFLMTRFLTFLHLLGTCRACSSQLASAGLVIKDIDLRNFY